jgi:amidase
MRSAVPPRGGSPMPGRRWRRSRSTSRTGARPISLGAAPGWSDSNSRTWLAAFGDNLRGNVEAGLTVTAHDLAAAENTRLKVFHRFRALFERHDVLLTPAAPVKPFPVEMSFPTEIAGRKLESYVDWLAPAFLITLVSLPAGSVPAGLTRDRLPVGLQVVAPRFAEPLILTVMRQVAEANPIGWPPLA